MTGQVDLFGQSLEPPVPVVPFQWHFGPRAVVCPACAAPVGSPCRRPSGHELFGGEFHRERCDLAGEVRLDGLACMDCGRADGPGQYVAPVIGGPRDGDRLCTTCVAPLLDPERDRVATAQALHGLAWVDYVDEEVA